MAIEKEIILKVNSDEAVQGIEKVDDSLQDATGSQNELAASTLASAKSFKFMGVSINDVSKALKFLKVSLIATGIGAIVVAIGTLAAAFLSTQRGVDALNSVLKPLGEVLATIWGIAQRLGDGLFDMVTGDITGGFNKMAGAVENLGDQLNTAWENGVRLHEIQIQIQENNINDGLVISRLNRLSSEQLEIAEDINNTVEERRTAFQSAIAAEEAITKLKQRQNDLLVEEAERKTRANDTDRESKQELNDLIARGEDIQNEGIRKRILLTKRLQTVKGEAFQVDNELVNPITGMTNTQLEEIITEQLDVSISEADRLNAYVIDANKKTQEQITKDEEIEQARRKETRLQAAIGSLQVAGDIAGALGSLAEEGSKEAKNAQIAGAVIQTLTGAIAAYASASAIPVVGWVLGPIAAAAALVAGYANVKKIESVDPSGRGGRPSTSSASVPTASIPSFNVVGTSDTNQLANTISEQEPVKAYVVASDVTTQQSMDRNIVDSASFG